MTDTSQPHHVMLTLQVEGEAAPTFQIVFDCQPADAEVRRFNARAVIFRAERIQMAMPADTDERTALRRDLALLLDYTKLLIERTADATPDHVLPIPGTVPS